MGSKGLIIAHTIIEMWTVCSEACEKERIKKKNEIFAFVCFACAKEHNTRTITTPNRLFSHSRTCIVQCNAIAGCIIVNYFIIIVRCRKLSIPVLRRLYNIHICSGVKRQDSCIIAHQSQT